MKRRVGGCVAVWSISACDTSVVEVRGVQDKQEGGRHCSLRCPSAAGDGARSGTAYSNKPWSVIQETTHDSPSRLVWRRRDCMVCPPPTIQVRGSPMQQVENSTVPSLWVNCRGSCEPYTSDRTFLSVGFMSWEVRVTSRRSLSSLD